MEEINCIRLFDNIDQATNEHWFLPAREIDPNSYMTDDIRVGDITEDRGNKVLNLHAIKPEYRIDLMDIMKMTYNDKGERRY